MKNYKPVTGINGKMKAPLSRLAEIGDVTDTQRYRRSHSWFARKGEHFCPYCGELLQVAQESVIVDTNNKAVFAYYFGSYPGENDPQGNMYYTYDIFHCEKCDVNILVEFMKNHEYEQKRLKRKQKRDMNKQKA